MSELKVVGSNKKEFKVDLDKSGNSGLLNSDRFDWDVAKVKENSYNIITQCFKVFYNERVKVFCNYRIEVF